MKKKYAIIITIMIILCLFVFGLIIYINYKPSSETNYTIFIKEKLLTINEGQNSKIDVIITPTNSNLELEWSSNNSNVAKVEDGLVTGINEGTTVIKVKILNSDQFAECVVRVEKNIINIESINLEKNTLELFVDDTVKLNYSITPNNATNKILKWQSDDPNIVQVDGNGNITAINSGDANITVESSNGITTSCLIKVKSNNNKIHFIKQSSSSDAILLESNEKYGMVDTGNFLESDNQLVLKYLRNNNVKELDFVLITHNHDDHIGGLKAIFNSEILINKLYIKTYICKDSNCNDESKNRFNEVINLANSKNVSISYIENDFIDGQGFNFNDMNIKLYNTVQRMSQPSYINHDENYNSVLQYITIGKYKTFLGSDIDGRNNLSQIINQIGEVDVVKVPHHAYLSCGMTDVSASVLNPKHLIVTNDFKTPGGTNSCVKYFNKDVPVYYVNEKNTSVIVNYDKDSIKIIEN